jgi:hypothetical protein
MIKHIPLALILLAANSSLLAQQPVGDTPTSARANDGSYIS